MNNLTEGNLFPGNAGSLLRRDEESITMTSFEIHEFEKKYLEEVIRLILSIQREEFSVPIDLEGQPDLNRIPEFYQKGKGNFWVATTGNEVAGTIALLDIGNRAGALRKMFVKKEFRGPAFGVGQALLDHLLEWAADKGMDNIYLGTTEKFLAAQRFYEKNGFKVINKNSLPEEFPIMEVDVKFYKYVLSR